MLGRSTEAVGQPAGPAEAAKPDGLERALRAILRGEVRFDRYTRHLFSADASMYAIEPLGVVFPRDRDDVAAAVAIAAEFALPVLPRGAGTSLAGQAVGRALIMDLSRHMSRIIDLDPASATARVQPGVVQEQLNRAAGLHGLMLGADTSTRNRATLGGMIGNNSAGSRSVRYGMTVDHVQSLDVVLSDASTAVLHQVTESERLRRASQPTLEGALYRELPALMARYQQAIATGFPAWWRQSGGYRLDRLAESAAGGGLDLAKLVVGSEGTLATVTEATVGLVPLPANRVIAVGHFTSVQSAIEATEDALTCDPEAVELIDRTILDLSREKIEYRALASFVDGNPEALLIVTLTGDTPAEATATAEMLSRLWQRNARGYCTLVASTAPQIEAISKVRDASLGLLMAASTGTRRPLAFVEDTAVEPAKLAAYTVRFRDVLDRHGLAAGFYGHCSVGCLHIRPFVDLRDPAQQQIMRAVAEEIRDLVLEFGGVNSSEHGDGLARSEFNRHFFGQDLYEAMCETKRLFDPGNTMNPGKIVDAPAMTDHLRDPALPAMPPLATQLDFDTEGGMRGAADRCMNIGVCRKTATGVMCPSYMATSEEEHSTRGRANALVMALSQANPREELGSERLHDILDLCLECKACRSECPLGVDMAALKIETLAAYYDQHGTPLRARLFGAIRTLNRLGSAMAPVANRMARTRMLRVAGERWFGIAAARPLPEFARRSLATWHAERSHRTATPARTELLFLADSFTTYTEPSAGQAAIELLEAAGWSPRLVTGGCCGRASLSKGLIRQARQQAQALVAEVGDLVSAGILITGVEPSCLLTLRDELLRLMPADPMAHKVAAAIRLPEELILQAITDGKLQVPADNPLRGRRILFHGHCHQKALAGTATTMALLQSIPGVEVAEVDAGCCGMAGSFGFEAEHYELSMRIGGLRLFPAVAGEAAETIVAATGVSCRQQIAHGTGRTARHPVEILRQATESAL